MSSLMVPRHIADARMRAKGMDPTADVVKPKAEGSLDFPDDWFNEEKGRIRERIGPVLDLVRLTLNQVLVAIFVRPEMTAGGIKLVDSFRNEDKYQGVTGLVLKLGPRCFEDSDVLTWTDADKFAVGDWVMFRRGASDGVALKLNGVDCFHFKNEQAIRMIIPRPDVVF